MKYIAPAKINLFLHITGRREDQFHLLDSLFVFTKFGDVMTITPDDKLTLTIDGPFQSMLSNVDDNLVYHAALLLKEKYKVKRGARIQLSKHIPVSAGLGGGSSDAATVLKGLNELWQLNLDVETLVKIGLSLGADVPACLYQKPLLVSGIGEQIKPITLSSKSSPILLVNPNKPLSTLAVFQAYKKQSQSFTEKAHFDNASLTLIKQQKNDLEIPAITLMPEIKEILNALVKQTHCELARMSGSGPTCFAVFLDEKSAQTATQNMRQRFPNYWIKNTTI